MGCPGIESGKPICLKKIRAVLYTTNPIWAALGSNLSLHVERPVTSRLRCNTAPLWFRKLENNCLLRGSNFSFFRVQKYLRFFLRTLWPLKTDGANSSETSGNNKRYGVTFQKAWIVVLNVVTSPITLFSSIPVFIVFKRHPFFLQSTLFFYINVCAKTTVLS